MPEYFEFFDHNEAAPAYWPNAIQAFLSTGAAGVRLRQSSATAVAIDASANTGLVALAIQGRFRYIEANISASHPGGAAATYDVWATASDNSIGSSPVPFTDNTVYAFALAIRASGSPPATALKRKIGRCVWDGSKITAVYQEVDSPLLTESGFMPGDLKATARPTAPDGWLICDGSAVSRTTYAALFAAIGTTYGAGDGSTTFGVPDLRGRVPVGVDGAAGRLAANDALGQSGGAETVTLAASELPAHSHPVGVETGSFSGGSTSLVGSANARDVTAATDNSTGGGGAHQNMPPYQVVNYVIKT